MAKKSLNANPSALLQFTWTATIGNLDGYFNLSKLNSLLEIIVIYSGIWFSFFLCWRWQSLLRVDYEKLECNWIRLAKMKDSLGFSSFSAVVWLILSDFIQFMSIDLIFWLMTSFLWFKKAFVGVKAFFECQIKRKISLLINN